MQQIKLSESVAARRRIPVKMVDATDGVTEETGLTPTATISKNGAAFGAGSGSIVSVNGTGQNGSYYYDAASGDLDTLGYLEVRVTDAAARTFYALVQIVAKDPYADSIGSVVGAVGSVTGNVGGNVTGSIGSVASGGITAASIATDAITAAKISADAITEIQAGLATSAALSAGVSVASIAANAITAAATNADFTAALTAAIDSVLSLSHGSGSWVTDGIETGSTPAQLWQHVIEGTFTAEQLVRLISSALFGNASGLEGSQPLFRDLANTKNRITASYSGGTRIVATRDGV